MPSNDTVLFVSPGPDLSNPASGEGTRLRNLSRELATRDWTVFTLVPQETGSDRPEWVTRQYTYEQWSVPHLTDLNPSFVRSIRRVLSRESIDVVHLSRGVCAAKAVSTVGSEATVVYAAQNVEADHARDFVDPDLPAYKRLLGPRLIPFVERASVRCADGVTTVSERDRERFIKRYGLTTDAIHAVPTGTTPIDRTELDPPSVVRDQLGIDDGPLVVFHGSYEHPPNREAAELINDQIAPALADHGVEASFLIVGKGPPKMSSANVHAPGFVDDLYSALHAADIAVVPIRHGGGTKTKLYDYISLSLPIVATKTAVEGVDIEPDRHGLITDAVDEEFVSNTATLLRDSSARTRLAANLSQLAREWNWSESAANLDTAYRLFD